ncbi:MAG: amidohydrolase family protein [Dehalococcoidia bacterium]|nr:amidohydrolase family protein [Dehalococcoidia bacterium]
MSNMKLEKEYALIGATLIDGNGGIPVKNVTIVVRNGVIEEVGDKKSVRLEDSIQKVDISGFYLMPGLIDAHVHIIGVAQGPLIDNIIEPNYLQAIRTVAEAGKLLDHGFTAVRSAGSRYDVYLKRAIEEGTIPGPRILACGLGLCRSRGHGDSVRRDIYEIPEEWADQGRPKAQTVDGVEEIRKAIRKLVAQNVDHIKFWATGGGAWEKERCTDMHFSMEEMKTIIDESHMVGLKVMCHAESLQSVKTIVELGVNSVEHGDNEDGDELDEETCRKMAEKNIFLTPTLSIYPIELEAGEEIPQYLINGWKRAIKNGVKILSGTDAWADPITPYGKYNIGEIKLLVDLLGMTPLQAITSATKFGAEACSIDDKVGTIEKGKLADLLVVKKDPSKNVDILLDKENIKYVVKDGNLAAEH